MNSKNRLVFQAVFAVGLVGQLLLLDVSRRLMVHDDDVIMVNPDMRRQNLCLRIDGMAAIQFRCGRGDQPQVTPAPLMAAFGGCCDFFKLDVIVSSLDALGCFGDNLITQDRQLGNSQQRIFGDQIPGMIQ